DAAAAIDSVSHSCNARTLRARLRLETGDPDEALRLTTDFLPMQLIPSWRAEHIATRALALACSGKHGEARVPATQAVTHSQAVEVRVLAGAAQAVAAIHRGEVDPATQLLRHAEQLGAWDPIVCACRASQTLADALAAEPSSRSQLEALYAASED